MSEAPNLEEITLDKGAHSFRSDGVCAMELVAWIAGEEHSDHPACACPVLTEFVMRWNDALEDEPRNRILKPLIPRLVGTRASEAVAEKRSFLALDWLIREAAPAWLDLVPALAQHATALRAANPIVDLASAKAIRPFVVEAEKASSAAGSAARSAAESAAWSAAESAAWSAARSAAWSAAYEVMRPTSESLQRSALALVEAMLAVVE